jgi:cytoskeleton protein RodZ
MDGDRTITSTQPGSDGRFDGSLPHAGPARVGAELRMVREQLGWTLPALSARLKIRLPFLAAIEAGDLAALPAPAYAAGFIRTYADAMGLDPDEILRRFRAEGMSRAPKPELAFPDPVPDRAVPPMAVALIVAVIAIGGYAFWYHHSEEQLRAANAVPPVPAKLAPLAIGSPNTTAAPAGSTGQTGMTAARTGKAPGKATGQAPGQAAGQASGQAAGQAPGQAAGQPSAKASGTAAMAPSATAPAAGNAAPVVTGSAGEATTSPSAAAGAAVSKPAGAAAATAPRGSNGGAAGSAPRAGNPTTAGAASANPAAAARAPAATPAATSAPSSASQATAASNAAPTPGAAAGSGAVSTAQPSGSQPSGPQPSAPQAAGAQASAPQPSGSGLEVSATSKSWVQVRGPDGKIVFSGILDPGQSWAVPNEPGLVMTTGNAGGTVLVRNGQTGAPLGAPGTVKHGVQLTGNGNGATGGAAAGKSP